MRRGVADLHRRAEVSQKANERLWDALSRVDDSARLSEFTRSLEQPCPYRGRRVRALHPSKPTIVNCCKPSTAASSRSTATETETSSYTCAGQSIPITLSRRKRSAADPPRLAITAILTMDRTSIALLNKAAA